MPPAFLLALNYIVALRSLAGASSFCGANDVALQSVNGTVEKPDMHFESVNAEFFFEPVNHVSFICPGGGNGNGACLLTEVREQPRNCAI